MTGAQVSGTDALTAFGLAPHDKQLIVVESTQHFRAVFAPLARAVPYVSTPGAISPDFEHIDCNARSLDDWPRGTDPHRWAAPAAAP